MDLLLKVCPKLDDFMKNLAVKDCPVKSKGREMNNARTIPKLKSLHVPN